MAATSAPVRPRRTRRLIILAILLQLPVALALVRTGAISGVLGHIPVCHDSPLGRVAVIQLADCGEIGFINPDGQWEQEDQSSWTETPRAYQAKWNEMPRISPTPEAPNGSVGFIYRYLGVSFDGWKATSGVSGFFIEAKANYAQFVDAATGRWKTWFSGGPAMLEQARAQIDAIAGRWPLNWYFLEQEAADAFARTLTDAGLRSFVNISVVPF